MCNWLHCTFAQAYCHDTEIGRNEKTNLKSYTAPAQPQVLHRTSRACSASSRAQPGVPQAQAAVQRQGQARQPFWPWPGEKSQGSHFVLSSEENTERTHRMNQTNFPAGDDEKCCNADTAGQQNEHGNHTQKLTSSPFSYTSQFHP